jgi:hypothetical protein
MDGLVNEWPAERFTVNKATTARYAADNDANNLFLAISIPAPATQAKIMQAGMKLYIDMTGNKKEWRNVEFPLINENGSALPVQQHPDVKAIRSAMILNLIKLKLSGFSDSEPSYQELTLPGSVNIVYNWDSSDVMHIEYRIPLSLLGEHATFNQKNISIGWKLYAIQGTFFEKRVVATSTQAVSVPARARPSQASGVNTLAAGTENAGSEVQQFWGKYLIMIPK